jgi:hypothetical protein
MGGAALPMELRLCLRAGSVFYFQSRELASAQRHFFVVVNREPLATRLLLLTIVSSKVEKVRLRNRERPQTVVEISPQEYGEFNVASVIDCNVVIEKPLSELAGLVVRREVRYHKDLPPALFAKVKAAIQASPLVAEELKKSL